MRYTRTVISPGFTAAQLDAEFQKIEQAIADTYSRVGDSPNQMQTDLDMNSRRIFNLPDAVQDDEPLPFGQFNEALQSGNFNVIVQGTQNIQDSGSTINPAAVGLNFTGDITVTNGVNNIPNVNVTFPAAPVIPELDIFDQGVQINTADVTKIDFTTGSVVVTEAAPGEIDIAISSTLTVEEADVPIVSNTVGTLNFLGGGVTVTDAGGGQVDINISGGATSVVNSVNGKSGAVTLVYSDITSGLLQTDDRIISNGAADADVFTGIRASGDVNTQLRNNNGGVNFGLDSSGAMKIEQTTSGAGNFEDTWIDGARNGAVTLYHNNSAKLATTSTGIAVTGGATFSGAVSGMTSLSMSGNIDLNNNDLLDVGDITVNNSITADTVNVNGSVVCTNGTQVVRLDPFSTDAEVSAYTAAGGYDLQVNGSTGQVRLGQVSSSGGLEDNWITCARNSAVTLYHNNASKFSTTSSGVNVNGTANADAFVTDGTTEVGFDHNRASASPAIIRARNSEGGAAFRTDSARLQLYQTNSSGTLQDIWVECVANAGVNIRHNNGIKLQTETTGVSITGNMSASGNVTAGSSDERLKNIDQYIQPEECLDTVLNLEPIRYTPNGINPYESKVPMVGLIAQQLCDDFPELTPLAPFDRDKYGDSLSGENYMTIEYDRLVAVLVGAIQAQQDQIDELKEKIEWLSS